MKTVAQMPAFPCGDTRGTDDGRVDGMSLRAYIATAALQGMYACLTEEAYQSYMRERRPEEGRSCQVIARLSVEAADALIAELSK